MRLLGNAAGRIKRSRGQGAPAVLGSFSLPVQDVIDGLLRRGAGLNHQPGIAFESLDPASQIGRVVAQGDLLDAGMAGEERRAHLGDQFLFGVVRIAKLDGLIERRPVEPMYGTRAMGKFVERKPVAKFLTVDSFTSRPPN